MQSWAKRAWLWDINFPIWNKIKQLWCFETRTSTRFQHPDIWCPWTDPMSWHTGLVWMVADGSGKHYACILRLWLINVSQQQPPSAASMMSIKWSRVPIRANVFNFPHFRQLENWVPPPHTRQHVECLFQSESDQITWLNNFPRVKARWGKSCI